MPNEARDPAERIDDRADAFETGGDGGAEPSAISPGGPPNWPFSIKITIEIKGQSACPPEVRVK